MWVVHFVWRLIKRGGSEALAATDKPESASGLITEFTSALRQVMNDQRETTRELMQSLYAVRDEIRELSQTNQLVANTVGHMHKDLSAGQERIEDDVRHLRNRRED